jgi:hypothetical protein
MTVYTGRLTSVPKRVDPGAAALQQTHDASTAALVKLTHVCAADQGGKPKALVLVAALHSLDCEPLQCLTAPRSSGIDTDLFSLSSFCKYWLIYL